MKKFHGIFIFVLCFALLAACLASCDSDNKSKDKSSPPATEDSSYYATEDSDSFVAEDSDSSAIEDSDNAETDSEYIEYAICNYNYLFNLVTPSGEPLNEDDFYTAANLLKITGLNTETVDEGLLYIGANFDEEFFDDGVVPSPDAIIQYVDDCLEDCKNKPLSFKNSDGEVLMDYAAVKEAFVTLQSEDGSSLEFVVRLEFTDEGAKQFAEITDEISKKDDGENYLAIYVGDELLSMPTVEERIDSDSVIITSPYFEDDQSEAERLAIYINAGTTVDFEFEMKLYKEIPANLIAPK